jgi:hypothetical protein
MDLRAELQPLNTQVKATFSNPKAKTFATMISNHGEVQVYLASKRVHSVHLGDNGYIDDEHLVYQDRQRKYVVVFWDSVEMIDFHNGYEED